MFHVELRFNLRPAAPATWIAPGSIRAISSTFDVRCSRPTSDPTRERPAWFRCNHELARTFTSPKHCVHLAKRCGEPTHSGFDALDGAARGAGALQWHGRTSRRRPGSGASSPGRPTHGSPPSSAEATPAVQHRWRPSDDGTDCAPAWPPARSQAARRLAPIGPEPLPRVSRATGGHAALRRRASCGTLVNGPCFAGQVSNRAGDFRMRKSRQNADTTQSRRPSKSSTVPAHQALKVGDAWLTDDTTDDN